MKVDRRYFDSWKLRFANLIVAFIWWIKEKSPLSRTKRALVFGVFV